MTHGSLFSGIGGFDLVAARVGWVNVFSVENDKFCDALLRMRFKGVKRYGDIKEFAKNEAKTYRGRIDVISGGDPCQPHSTAGKRVGKEDVRYLWPEMLAVIKAIGPRWVVNENVVGSISNGVFDEKCAQLESIGYACRAFVIPASAVGLPHRRYRVWIVAYRTECGAGRAPVQREGEKEKGTIYQTLPELIYR